MEVGEELSTMATISKSTAVTACVAMTLLYVAILYAPTLIFRLPPPTSYQQFMIRRFVCAAASSLLCVFISFFLLLPVKSWKITYVLNLYGIQADNVWHAVIFPLSLTSLVYAGSLVLKCLLLLDSWIEDGSEGITLNCLHNLLHKIYCGFISVASNIGAWRNLVVAPITEELVFRACMIPLLLCGGFKVQAVLLLCPMFFSLAHLNHLLEFYFQKNHSLLKTSLAVGTQLAYTMIFGSYASFLFIRSGHLSAPLVAHIVCNYMGLPAVYARRKGVVVSLAFISGTMAFIKEKDTAWFVKFCVPWCKHCKNLGSLWEDLGKAMEGEDEIEVGQVDCSTSKPVCSEVDIHSYPTFKLFYNGEEVAKYQGKRDVESLKAFVLEETEKAAAKAEDDIDREL